MYRVGYPHCVCFCCCRFTSHDVVVCPAISSLWQATAWLTHGHTHVHVITCGFEYIRFLAELSHEVVARVPSAVCLLHTESASLTAPQVKYLFKGATSSRLRIIIFDFGQSFRARLSRGCRRLCACCTPRGRQLDSLCYGPFAGRSLANTSRPATCRTEGSCLATCSGEDLFFKVGPWVSRLVFKEQPKTRGDG